MMSVSGFNLPLPSNIIDNIYFLCRKFIWSAKNPPIAWTMFCKPIDGGGFGLKILAAWNNIKLDKTL